MNCKAAGATIVRIILGEAEGPEPRALQVHLESCPRCARRFREAAAVVEAVCSLQAGPVPPEVVEACDMSVARALRRGRSRGSPPAVPTTAPGLARKVTIFVFGISLLVLVNVAALLISGRIGEPEPAIGRLEYRSGRAELSYRGARFKEPAMTGRPLFRGATVYTDPNGLARIRTDGAAWWLDSGSTLELAGPSDAYLIRGRVFVECDEGAGEPVRLGSDMGTSTSEGGAFVARASALRFCAVSTEGELALQGRKRTVSVAQGEMGICTRSGIVDPVRRVRPQPVLHWLLRFRADAAPALSAQECVRMPLSPGRAALPPRVLLEELHIRLNVRGPLVLVSARARLGNASDEPWSGVLELREVLSAALVVPSPAGTITLPANGIASVRLVALALMRPRGGTYGITIDPRGWTETPIADLSVQTSGRAEGGFAGLDSPGHSWEIGSQGEDLSASFSARDFGTELPMRLEFKFRSGPQVDAMLFDLGEEAAKGMVLAGRGLFEGGAALRKGNVIIALDAASDYGPSGISCPYELLEELLAALPPRCQPQLVAYDGGAKFLRAAARSRMASDSERMLIALWSLTPAKGGRAGEFLHELPGLLKDAQKTECVIYVTGPHDLPGSGTGRELEGLPDSCRLVTVQVGADQPGEFYRSACLKLGGVAAAVPSSAHPAAAAQAILEGLRWSALRRLDLRLSSPVEDSSVLSAAGRFSNYPVLVLIRPGPGAAAVKGKLIAAAGEERVEKAFEFPLDESAAFSGEWTSGLWSGLESLR